MGGCLYNAGKTVHAFDFLQNIGAYTVGQCFQTEKREGCRRYLGTVSLFVFAKYENMSTCILVIPRKSSAFRKSVPLQPPKMP